MQARKMYGLRDWGNVCLLIWDVCVCVCGVCVSKQLNSPITYCIFSDSFVKVYTSVCFFSCLFFLKSFFNYVMFFFSIFAFAPMFLMASQLTSLAVHLLQCSRQAIIVDASALGSPHRVCPSIWLAFQAQQYIFQSAIVDLVLLQQFLLAHRMCFTLQLIDDGILQGDGAS